MFSYHWIILLAVLIKLVKGEDAHRLSFCRQSNRFAISAMSGAKSAVAVTGPYAELENSSLACLLQNLKAYLSH